MKTSTDYLIVGAGIIGLAIASSLRERYPESGITVIDKESGCAAHQSGRNSGVLHAGFYYNTDSLKAKFTVEGNRRLTQFCKDEGVSIVNCGKLVVATDAEQDKVLDTLYERGVKNGVSVELVDLQETTEIEPKAKTFKRSLYSPSTSVADPIEVSQALVKKLEAQSISFIWNCKYIAREGEQIQTSKGTFECKRLINCAGLYADSVAHDWGFGKKYEVLPFKGLYLKYSGEIDRLRTHIYPVPDLRNPFLGVHFTVTSSGGFKVGPTAIPAFWREHYSGFDGFNFSELSQILLRDAQLFLTNSFGFRDLAFEEIKKYSRNFMLNMASELVTSLDRDGFKEFTRPGIRATLYNKETNQLVQDFIVEGDSKSTHILNANSPAWTCSFPFADYIVESL